MTLATLGLPKKATRVARTAEELSAPVHLPTVGSLNVNKVVERMNETTKKRFKEVWTLTTTFSADNMVISDPMPDIIFLIRGKIGGLRRTAQIDTTNEIMKK